MAGKPIRCQVCVNLPLKDFINARFGEGVAVQPTWKQAREAGYKLTYAAVRIHREHTNTPQMQMALSKAEGVKPRDLAVVVRDRTLEAVESGELQITDSNWRNITPGLQAQSLLDKREQKVDDRKTALLLAEILYGGATGLATPPERLLISDGEDIEGEFVEVLE